jgi:tRNA(Ile)-lysidine synthase
MHDLEERLRENWPPASWCDLTVLVGVSGGADSVALLRAMLAVHAPGEGKIVVGHFHHGLRGAEADGDAEFVAALCRRFDLPCEVGRGDLAASVGNRPGSVEEACRKARYRFLRETAERLGARYVATAHTSDDQVETILHHIIRGTGIRGLGGMRRCRPLSPGVSIIRPFLPFRRREILEYLGTIEQPHREDLTNTDVALTRNRLRHELIPHLTENYGPAVTAALLRLGRVAREAHQALLPLLKDLADRCVRDNGDLGVTIDCRQLGGQPRHLARELFVTVWDRQGWPRQTMSFTKWDELAHMATVEPPAGKIQRRMFPGGITVQRAGSQLRLTPPSQTA